MRKSVAALAIILSAACTKTNIVEVEVPVSIPLPEKVTLSLSELSVPSNGGPQSVTVTSEGEWTLYGSSSWCTPSATYGVSGDEVSFAVDPNIMDERKTEFTFVCDNMTTRLTVTQKEAGKVPSDEIWYTTMDGKVLELGRKGTSAPAVVSNTYGNGKGVIRFDGNITEILPSMFEDCVLLSSVNIPGTVTAIGSNAFRGCSGLESINIPESVSSIGHHAFIYCYSLKELRIPERITVIEQYTFQGCYGLTGFNIPENVTSIGESAFRDCHSLTGIDIPEKVTSIGRAAFQDCYGLVSFTVPENVTAVNDDVFRDCYSLSEITLPESVASIGKYAFKGCRRLKEIKIPHNVASIGESAFQECGKHVDVEIPSPVTFIGANAFRLTNVKNFYVRAQTPPDLGGYSIVTSFYTGGLEKIYVPSGTADTYKADKKWSNYEKYIEETVF